jgi:hypothetical protein
MYVPLYQHDELMSVKIRQGEAERVSERDRLRLVMLTGLSVAGHVIANNCPSQTVCGVYSVYRLGFTLTISLLQYRGAW